MSEKNYVGESEVIIKAMEGTLKRLQQASSAEDVARLGEAIATMEKARATTETAAEKLKAEKETALEEGKRKAANETAKIVLSVFGTIAAAAIGGVATYVASTKVANIKAASHMAGIDKVAGYEKQEDLIFTGKTYNEIEKL